MKKISHNEYFNIRGLIPMLLPHIEYEKENIKTLNDIYTKKTAEFTDPDTEAVEYVHSNIQYSRCKKRTKYSKTQEITFSESHLEHAYKLASHTIKMTSNKLSTNWIEVVPLNPDEAFNNKKFINHLSISSVEQ